MNNKEAIRLFCGAVLYVLSSSTVIVLRKRELIALLKQYSCCHVAVSVLILFFAEPWVGLWLLLTVPWVGLWHVIVAFPSHDLMLNFEFIHSI